MAAEQPNNIKKPCAQDCWPMYAPEDEYHTIITTGRAGGLHRPLRAYY